ncbi:MAG TPA: DegT/DnrJ/EryC1/StrS family aminotransferase [Candidatus Hydrogenedens sp.]|nr:DegT/DnrJ/EryC1/StrS family aminotransferase [Candidatus Hydrogenedens sp.]HPP58888.1 DegT/DnrJ/EryC1/StrS family aminotransferase [Candidatus Hydrogenedens sp.]
MGNNDTLAIFGGEPVRPPEKKWQTWPVFDEQERKALLDILESGKWFYGEKVKQFEEAYSRFQGAQYCVSCSSGTTALEITLQAINIKPGDEVIVPPYTFIATASAVVRMGGVPIFVDIDDTWCIDPDLIESAITPRTRAIIPVHFGGRICDMDKINAIANEHNLTVIEDACHAWGGAWEGKGAGTLGIGGVFSFQMSKNITAGEGGAIVTNEECFADLCRSISNCGRSKTGPWYYHERIGTNVRMNEFTAGILSAQLSRARQQFSRREINGTYLNNALKDIPGIYPQPNSNRITKRCYHLFCIRLKEEEFGCSREQFVKSAQAEGLPISAGYPYPIYKQPAFQQANFYDYSKVSCPVAEDLCYKSGLWLTHQILLGSEDDMEDIVKIIKKIQEHAPQLRKLET